VSVSGTGLKFPVALTVALAFSLAPTIARGGTTVSQAIKVERVADNLVFPEGPVWHPDGFLLFSDVHGKTIERLKPGGGSETWFDRGKKTNGLIMSNDGSKIYACCYSEFELLEIDARTKEFRVLANGFKGRPLNNVNDVAVDAKGNVFFTDPKWGPKEGDIQGVYRLRPNGDFDMAVQLDQQPNGLVVGPDQKWMYVARSGAHHIFRFRLGEDGSLADGAVWGDLEPGDEPDGMTVDSKGNVYVAQAGNGRLRVLSPEGKTLHLVQIVDRMATNCEFQPGTYDKVLYVTGGGKNGQRTGCVWKVTFP
jgi:gluconolactonase